MKQLKIRSSGKYYQVGYYDKGNWVNVEHIGTAERCLKLIRAAKEKENETYQNSGRIKTLSEENPESSEKRIKKVDQ